MLAFFAAIVAALPQFAPLLIQLGLWALNLFIKDQAQRDANTQAFLQAIADHVNDAQATVSERQNAWDQLKDLKAKAAARDAANQTPPALSTKTAEHVQAETVWKKGPAKPK